MRRALLAIVIGLTGASHLHARQTLTIVAPAAPGGGWDQTARVMQQVLGEIESSPSVQVENVPGAAGTIGLARFVSAERGNAEALLITGLVMVSGIVTNRAPVTLAETTPIARLTGEYEVIVVPAASPWRSLSDLLAAFKTEPARVSWGGGSAGGTDDLLVRLIAHEVGVPAGRVNYIAFPGGGAALAALLGNQVTAGVSGYAEFAGQIDAGTLRLLAVSAPTPVAAIDAPTLRQQGIAVDLANWRGVVAPPGLREQEREALTARLSRMTSSPQWKAVLAKNGWEDLFLTGAPFRQFVLAEQRRVEQVLRTLDASAGSGRSPLQLTPHSLPRIALGATAVLMIAVIAQRFKAARSDARAGDSTAVAVLLASLIIHAFLMPRIGFVPASAALFVVVAKLMGSRHLVRDIAIGVAGAFGLFVIFTRWLGITL
jgi:putative tricarboxylic transport membrane protein